MTIGNILDFDKEVVKAEIELKKSFGKDYKIDEMGIAAQCRAIDAEGNAVSFVLNLGTIVNIDTDLAKLIKVSQIKPAPGPVGK